MGVGKQGGKDLIASLKLATPDRVSLRSEIADAITVLQTKICAIDFQLATAHADFAASKPTQFANFIQSLPDIGDTP